jgi:hypothetical protein
MIGRREFITLLGGAAAAWPIAARAQRPESVKRLGVLIGLAEHDPEAKARLIGFWQAFERLGWFEDRDVLVDYRYAPAGAGAQARAKELSRQKVQVQRDSRRGPSEMKYLLAIAALLAVSIAPAAGELVPLPRPRPFTATMDAATQYRGLWCSVPKTSAQYYHCRRATDEGYLEIRGARINLFEGEFDCRINGVASTAKGHRLYVRCGDVALVKVDLSLDARGRLHFRNEEEPVRWAPTPARPVSHAPEYRHGDSFTLPFGTLMCEVAGGKGQPPEACRTAREVQIVKLWGEPREDWCLIVHWIDSGKPGLSVAAWKAWVLCESLKQ